MENLLTILNLERNTGDEVIFIEGESLEDATSFSQYVWNNRRLITIIGELHNISLNCKSPTVAISKYIQNTIERNPRARVLLEYNAGQDVDKIGSRTLVETYYGIESSGKTRQIIPIDFRAFFIGSKGQSDLYGVGALKYDEKQLVDTYIESFYKNLSVFSLVESQYSPTTYKYLSDTFIRDVDSNFQHIYMYRNESKEKTIFKLRDVWKKIADFFILREVLKYSEVDEYIILVGQYHWDNLDSVFSTGPFIKKMVNRSATDGNCIPLLNTYRINLPS